MLFGTARKLHPLIRRYSVGVRPPSIASATNRQHLVAPTHLRPCDAMKNIVNQSMVLAKTEETRQITDLSRHEEMRLRQDKRLGNKISSRDKINFLFELLNGLNDSKEAVYGALDAWVAWEKDFPIIRLRRALLSLQKEGHWHRVVQVLKWILSKGQGNTMGTYELLILALDRDKRPEEAHNIWKRKSNYDLRSVSWKLCDLMISIYYRNNMLDRLVKLFKELESHDRKPPRKSIVRKVTDACEMMGSLEEKQRILDKYNYLFNGTPNKQYWKSQKASKKMEDCVGMQKKENVKKGNSEA